MPLNETTDANRLLALSSPALKSAGNDSGRDVLLVNQVSATESISRMFRFDLDVKTELSKADQVSGEKLLGKEVTIRLQLRNSGSRFFHGIVNQFIEGEEDNRFRFYQLQVVPWLWLLTLNSDCRIFQNLTVPEILREVFKPFAPFAQQVREDLHRNYTRWDYCVQYRETHFNFVSRLMEEEGIFYFFDHDEDKHNLVISDTAQLLNFGDFQTDVLFAPAVGIGEDEEVITSWQRSQQLSPGLATLRDYHFELPTKTLEAIEFSTFQVGGSENFEVYDFPGGYAQKFNGDDRLATLESDEPGVIARLRMEEEETPHETLIGNSNCRGLQVATKFDLNGHPTLSNSYLIKSIQHTVLQSPAHISGQEVGGAYNNTLTCMTFGRAYRPNRVSLRPVVQGPQSAVVVGPDPSAGGDKEEIHTDPFGRVKVQFPWDRLGQKNDTSSAFLRVAQPWSGTNWGAIFIPRVGQEVLVDFLEGDPDQPIIIGSLYNKDNMPPYKLPDNKTQSGIKTRSVKKGTTSNFNEIRFEDKKGAEELVIHAERNLNETVEVNTTESVGADRFLIVGHNQVEEVTGIKAAFVEKSLVEHIQENKFLIIVGDRDEAVVGNYCVEGNANVEFKGDENVIISSDARISLVVGGSFIDISDSAIAISAPMVQINSGGSAPTPIGVKPPSEYGDDLKKFDTWQQVADQVQQQQGQNSGGDDGNDGGNGGDGEESGRGGVAPSPNPLPPPPLPK